VKTIQSKSFLNKIADGWEFARPIDKERYGPKDGLEGPFGTRSGKVVYYDPKEGKYYDPDSDLYLTSEQAEAYNQERPNPHLQKSPIISL